MIPINIAANIIEQYITMTTGQVVKIKLPIQPHEEDKFIQAFNVAVVKLNVNINVQ
jgi:hypothetical protein